jgi:hypothetical protein
VIAAVPTGVSHGPAARERGPVGLMSDGIVYVSLADACALFGMSSKALRALRGEHGLTRYSRLFDRRRYLRLHDLMAAIGDTARAMAGER